MPRKKRQPCPSTETSVPATRLAIDPGRNQGYAVFQDTVLIECGLGKPPTHFWYKEVIVEHPVIYRNQKVPPNDIVKLAIRAGEAVGTVQALCPNKALKVVWFKPAEWKASTNKVIHNKRVLAALTPEERKVFDSAKCAESLRNNIVDAIGIGLVYLERDVSGNY